jgi:phosphoglycerate kinase
MVTIRDVPLENIRNKRIFVLVDPNVERAAPALGSLRGKGARLVVATHLPGPPGGSTERLSLQFAQELSRVLGLRVIKLDSAVGPEVTRAVFDMRADEVVLSENLSIFKEDAANDVAFARQLGMLCEVFVNDAFDTADKPLASNTGITRWFLSQSQGHGSTNASSI